MRRMRGEATVSDTDIILGVAGVWLLWILAGVIAQAVLSEHDR